MPWRTIRKHVRGLDSETIVIEEGQMFAHKWYMRLLVTECLLVAHHLSTGERLSIAQEWRLDSDRVRTSISFPLTQKGAK